MNLFGYLKPFFVTLQISLPGYSIESFLLASLVYFAAAILTTSLLRVVLYPESIPGTVGTRQEHILDVYSVYFGVLVESVYQNAGRMCLIALKLLWLTEHFFICPSSYDWCTGSGDGLEYEQVCCGFFTANL